MRFFLELAGYILLAACMLVLGLLLIGAVFAFYGVMLGAFGGAVYAAFKWVVLTLLP